MIRMFGKDNPMWKGDKVGYKSLHEWVRNHKPKPQKCEICKSAKPIDLANISQEYKRDLDDWEWLCRRCHMNKDGRIKNLTPGIVGKNWKPPEVKYGKDATHWKGGKPRCLDCGKEVSNYGIKRCRSCYMKINIPRLISMNRKKFGDVKLVAFEKDE